MKDALDLETFVCCACGGTFDVTQGTWLPIGLEKKDKITTETNGVLTVMSYSDFLRPPEIVTSDKFTCYDCAN